MLMNETAAESAGTLAVHSSSSRMSVSHGSIVGSFHTQAPP